MRKTQILLCLLMTLPPASTPVSAATVPGRWEKVENLPAAAEIRVVMNSGDTIQGHFQEVTDDSLVLQGVAGTRHDFPKEDVRKVVRLGIRRQDSRWDGIAIGAGLGGVSYLGLRTLYGKPDQVEDVANTLIFTGIGIGIGALADSMVLSHQEVVYRSADRVQ